MLQSLFSVTLLLTSCVSTSPPLDAADQYLLQEFSRVISSKYESELDKPLTTELQSKLDALFDSSIPFFSDSPRTRRSSNEVKEEQLLLDGISEYGSIPVDFPRDICMFQVDDLEFAAVIHSTNISNPMNSTRLSIFRKEDKREFVRIYNESTPYIVNLDCISFGPDGFVATAVHISPENENLNSFCSVFKVQRDDKVTTLASYVWQRQKTVKLWKYGNDLFFIYTFENNVLWEGMSATYSCPIYKLSAGQFFDFWADLPCSNAVRVEAFVYLSDMYVAVANSKDPANKTETNSVIYKYDLNERKLVSFQTILVNRIVDIRYFTFKISGEVTQFLVITSASLIDSNEVAEVPRDGYSVVMIYKYAWEMFVPMQNIFVERPTHVLPHIWENKEMVLLIARENAPVEFYHYIGWKFYDTELHEISAAFELGVSSLRNYVNLKGDSLILVSNREQIGTSPNIFKAHFKLDEDPDLYQGIVMWCEDSIRELEGFDYEAILAQVDVIRGEQQRMKGDWVLNYNLILQGENVTVQKVLATTVHEHSFQAKEVEHGILQNIQEVAATMQEKLGTIGERIGRSMTIAEREEAQRIAADREIIVDELEVDEIETELINGVPVGLWAHTDQDLVVDTLKADQITVHGEVTFEKYEQILRSALKISGDQELDFSVTGEEVNVDHLEVRDTINGNDIQAITQALRQVSSDKDAISVDHVHVEDLHGLVNGIDWRELNGRVLKSNGDQTIDGWDHVENLVVGNNAEMLQLINGMSASTMVRIGDSQEREWQFNQGVNFAYAHFHDLHVQERIGTIKVKKNGGFDILLKRSSQEQYLRNETLFEVVRLLEPITLRGKIPDSGLNKMNPNVVVDGDIELYGDYEISGPVSVKRRLTTHNLLTADEQRSLGDLKNYGIPLSQEVIEGDIVFNQPLQVDRLQTYSVKGIPVDNLLKSGLKKGQTQIVTGRKRFTAPLVTVNGALTTRIVNGIDIEAFSQTVLTRTGEQNITGNIHFNQIEAFSLEAEYASLDGRDIARFYAHDKEMVVPGTVYFKGTVKPEKKLKIGTLLPSRPVFKYNITEVVHDTVFRYEADVRVIGKKVFKDRLEIRNLQTTGEFSKLAQVPGNRKVILQVNGDLLAEQIQCIKLVVHEDLNGFPADQFGHLWLSVEGDQMFSEHQTFRNLNADRVTLYGRMEQDGNAYDVNGAMKNTYLVNRREVVEKAAIFEYMMDIQGNLLVLGKVNSLRIPTDLILKNSTWIDVLHVSGGGDVRVDGEVIVNGLLNDVPLAPLFQFTLNEDPYLGINLRVNGTLEFLLTPLIDHLGPIDIDELYNAAWMLYNNVDIQGDVDFEELQLMADVHVEYSVNGRDLPHFAANRFSLSEPQRVAARLHFVNEMVTHGTLKADRLDTAELIGVGPKSMQIDLKYFADNSLKKDTNNAQVVSGDWHFKELSILGNLQNVLINGLNLVNDVVHKDSLQNFVARERTFDSLHIEHLHCGQVCYIQGVNIQTWMHQVVYLENNQNIQGNTVLENPEILNSIRVFGSVNERQFDRQSVLLKTENQYLNVSLYVNNQFDEKIHHLTVDRLDTDTINGHRIWEDRMDESVLVTHRMGDRNVVATPVSFRQSLVVDDLQVQGDTMFAAQMNDVQGNMRMRKLLEEQTRGFEDLLHVVEQAIQQTGDNSTNPLGGRFVKHFKVLQRVPGGDLKYLLPFKRNSIGSFNEPARHFSNGSSPTTDDIRDYLLAMVDGTQMGKLILLEYLAADNKFLPIGGATDFMTEITALKVLTTAEGNQIIFLQSRGGQRQSFRNQLLDFDGHQNQFRALYDFQSFNEIHVELISTDKGDVLVQYSPALETVDLFDVKWIGGGALALERLGEIAKREVTQVVPFARNRLALLVDKKQVEIWRLDSSVGRLLPQFVLPIVVDPIRMASIAYKETHLIAVHCSGNIVEIFYQSGSDLRHFQSLQVTDQMQQIRFVIMTSGELMLAVSTANLQRPLIVYRFAGLSLFVERMGYSRLGISGRRISDLIIGHGREPRNFMIMVADREAVILEAITER